MYTIRPHRFDEHDFRAQLDLHHLLWQEYPFSMEEWRPQIERAATNPTRFYHAFMVEDTGGTIVASGVYAEQEETYSPGTYWIDIRVHPDHQRRGIGGQAYAYIVNAAEARGEPAFRCLLSSTRTDRPHSLRFLEQRGFTVGLRTNASELDVAAFDSTRFEPLKLRLQGEGIRLASAAELEAEGWHSWRRALWELHQTLLTDVPSVIPYVPIAFEEYEIQVLQHASFHPSACFVALDGKQFVGMSYLRIRREKPEELETALTGTLRTYRRRGIATLLKVMGIDYAGIQGVTTIMTMNEEKNPMYQLNVQLGFKPLPSWVTYQRIFRSS